MTLEATPMPSPRDCPAIESWQALFDDRLSPDQHEGYERHLESCTACQQHLDLIREDEDKLRRLGRQGGDPTVGTADPTVVRVLQRLRELIGPERNLPAAAIDLHFLRACPRPGALGSLGAYEVEEVIGHGGMGVVLKAFEPALHRHVAIKVLAPALAGNGTARLRFTREAKAAAAVRHDHIVTVHGVHEADGLPYLVMEYVAGESLQDRIDRLGPLEPGEVVRIGLQTASALAAAHAQGLIHRDVKPANILLEGGLARVKITDFGLARTADDVKLTQAGVVAGTPEYMAPEQARGHVVDHRADLFSLGSVLYALCTGAPPFRAPTTLGVLHQVCDQAPAPLRTLNPAVPAWLEELVAGLLAKDPADRYGSAAEVAALLEGYQAHLRQPATVPAPALKAGKRQDPPARGKGWIAALLVSLSAGLLVALLLGLGALGRPLPWFGAGNGAPAPNADQPAPPRSDVWSVAISQDGRFLAGGAGWWGQPGEIGVWDLATHKPLQHFTEEQGVGAVAFSPDGKLLAWGSWSSHVRVLDWAARKEVADLPVAGVARLAFSPDGTLLATVCENKTAELWDVARGQLLADLEGDRFRFQCVTFSPDGRRVLAGGGDWKPGGVSQAVAWDVAGKDQVLKLVGHQGTVLSVAYSPDGKVIATGAADRTVRLWDADTGDNLRTLRGHQGLVESVAFAPGGKALVSGGHDHTVRLWDVEDARETGRIDAMPGEVRAVLVTPDGTTLVAGGARKTLKLFDLATHQELATLWDGADGQTSALDDPPVTVAPSGRGRLWLVVAFGLALPLGLALLVLYVHQRRRAAAAGAGPAEPAAPHPVSFPCPECDKGLKVRPGLRGKRVRCPGCGNAVRVPAAETGQAPR
jgi:eukaryotic-like serine/threonine-protein kinase